MSKEKFLKQADWAVRKENDQSFNEKNLYWLGMKFNLFGLDHKEIVNIMTDCFIKRKNASEIIRIYH